MQTRLIREARGVKKAGLSEENLFREEAEGRKTTKEN